MSDHIPIEIITNILDRITGVEDLVRWKLVSKEWLALIDSHDFIQRHLQRSSESSSSISKLGLLVDSIRHCTLNQNHPQALKHIRLLKTGGKLLGSCNGLICFWIYSDSRPQILNPATGERRYLRSFNFHHLVLRASKYGFGYDQLSDDYKLVIILRNRAEIHSVRTKSCRTVYNIRLDELVYRGSKGVFACGTLHWIDYVMDNSLYAFDLGSETASKLSLPIFDAGIFYLYGSREVGVVDSCLCISVIDVCLQRIDLWVMKEYGNEGSWVSIYKIDLSFTKLTDYSVSMVGFLRGRILFLLNRRELVWFDPESNRVEEAVKVTDIVDNHRARLDAFYWFDSLVKIYPDERIVKRKKMKLMMTRFSRFIGLLKLKKIFRNSLRFD